MCIHTRIQKILAEKEALDAQIVRLEKLESATSPVKNLLAELLADYSQEAPEELATVWEEVLAIGSKFSLSVQPLAADELQQWEATNAENQRLKLESEKWSAAAAISELAVKHLRSQLAQIQADTVNPEQLESAPEPSHEEESWADLLVSHGIDSIEGILVSHGFFMLDMKVDGCYDPEDKYEDYQDWAIYYTVTDKAGVTSDGKLANQIMDIGLDSPSLGFWAADTDYCIDNDSTFPQNLTEHDAIVAWTRKVIDEVVAITPIENPEVLGQLSLEFPEPTEEQIEEELGCNWEDDEEIPELGGNWEIDATTELQKLLENKSEFVFEDLGVKVKITSEFCVTARGEEPETVENANFTITDLQGECPAYRYYEASGLKEFQQYAHPDTLSLEGLARDYAEQWAKEQSPKPAQELTKLQKLLEGNSNFTFEELGVSVAIESVIAPADDTVDFESEEVRITATNASGKTLEYYVDGETFVFHYRVDHLEQTALGYAQHFLRDLEKEAGIKEKIAQWKTDNAQQPIEPVDPEPPKPETEFEAMGFKVEVHPQPPLGATFRFLNKGELVFSSSQTIDEIGDRDYKTCAWDLISNYRDKEAARLEKLANPHAKEEDKFVELVKLTSSVGYLKRRDNGELIAAYVAFANRSTATGEKTLTFAKGRAKKWASHLHSSFESCGWKVDEPRNISRMQAEPGAKVQFSYEIKITGKFSIGQLQKLAEEDFSLLPNEVKVVPIEMPTSALVIPQAYRVKVNSYELASGTEEEMRSRFEEEVKILGGSQMSVSLLTGSEVVESYRVADFEFLHIADFDVKISEYEVTHLPTQLKLKVWQRVETPPLANAWYNSMPHKPDSSNHFPKREAAAVDAVRRLLNNSDSFPV